MCVCVSGYHDEQDVVDEEASPPGGFAGEVDGGNLVANVPELRPALLLPNLQETLTHSLTHILTHTHSHSHTHTHTDRCVRGVVGCRTL